ncbi:hypothetical protein FG386_000803 [Cryptosporidium ryanae]|uniref:uncharacterized protein n=1 Tax=Cryptosporidium ryanae TaxID=515981 RepID=UPI00351A951F|nr:hypothetical protein FG386_000803 [Cryptosporidium ryanae]
MFSNTISIPRDISRWKNEQKLIVILDQACLELFEKKNKSLELLNGIDHPKKKLEEYCSSCKQNIFSKEELLMNIRPDIVHQCLLSLLDSPLNKSGKLLVYIRTTGNVLIEVNPQISIPRSFKEFSILMVNLLVKRKVMAVEENVVLMQMIKNDLEKVLPAGGKRFGLSINGKLNNLRTMISGIYSEGDNSRVCKSTAITFFIGAVAYGDPLKNCRYVEDLISISSFPLSAALCCLKLCGEFEYLWDIC